MNNNRYLSRVTPSVAKTVINRGPNVQIESDLVGGKPSEQGENQQQTQPTLDSEYSRQAYPLHKPCFHAGYSMNTPNANNSGHIIFNVIPKLLHRLYIEI